MSVAIDLLLWEMLVRSWLGGRAVQPENGRCQSMVSSCSRLRCRSACGPCCCLRLAGTRIAPILMARILRGRVRRARLPQCVRWIGCALSSAGRFLKSMWRASQTRTLGTRTCRGRPTATCCAFTTTARVSSRCPPISGRSSRTWSPASGRRSRATFRLPSLAVGARARCAHGCVAPVLCAHDLGRFAYCSI